jgi:hypothetical protein
MFYGEFVSPNTGVVDLDGFIVLLAMLSLLFVHCYPSLLPYLFYMLLQHITNCLSMCLHVTCYELRIFTLSMYKKLVLHLSKTLILNHSIAPTQPTPPLPFQVLCAPSPPPPHIPPSIHVTLLNEN